MVFGNYISSYVLYIRRNKWFSDILDKEIKEMPRPQTFVLNSIEDIRVINNILPYNSQSDLRLFDFSSFVYVLRKFNANIKNKIKSVVNA